MEHWTDPRDFHKCDACGYGTKALFNLLNHKRQHRRIILERHSDVFTCHNNIPVNYKCENCDFETNLQASLTHHLNLKHKDHANQNQFRNVLRQCGYCGFHTYSLLLLLKHCFKCDKREHLDIGEIHTNIIIRLECGQCSYTTQDKRDLRKHVMRMHTTNFTLFHCELTTKQNKIHTSDIDRDSVNIVWHNCNNCEYKSKWKKDLKKHIGRVHADSVSTVWHHCNKCQYKSKEKYCLRRHIEYIHTDSTNIVWYHCDTCKYKSKQKGNLQRHIANIHTDSGNMVWCYCDKCDYKTKYKFHLREHITNIHTDSSNIVWYHCDKCAYKAKIKSNLKHHIANIHTDSPNIVWYHCDQCEFKSKWKSDLRRHIANIHADSRNIVWYNCDICEHKTKWKYGLKQHIASKHADSAMWYHCDKCKYTTKDKVHLKTHITTFHTGSTGSHTLAKQEEFQTDFTQSIISKWKRLTKGSLPRTYK